MDSWMGNFTAITNWRSAGTLVSRFTHTYDPAGNLTEKAGPVNTAFYAYDTVSQMTVAEVPSGSVTLTYNADGQRIAKQSYDSTHHKFIYDFKKLLQETDANDVAQVTYTGTLQEFGELLSEYDEFDDETTFDTFNAQWSADALVDESQSVTEQYQYRAFGLITEGDATRSPLNFVGQLNYYNDADLDLYLLGTGNKGRYYDPAAARFTSQDPKGVDSDKEGSLYRYVENNPVNAVDPSGQSDEEEQLKDVERSLIPLLFKSVSEERRKSAIDLEVPIEMRRQRVELMRTIQTEKQSALYADLTQKWYQARFDQLKLYLDLKPASELLRITDAERLRLRLEGKLVEPQPKETPGKTPQSPESPTSPAPGAAATRTETPIQLLYKPAEDLVDYNGVILQKIGNLYHVRDKSTQSARSSDGPRPPSELIEIPKISSLPSGAIVVQQPKIPTTPQNRYVSSDPDYARKKLEGGLTKEQLNELGKALTTIDKKSNLFGINLEKEQSQRNYGPYDVPSTLNDRGPVRSEDEAGQLADKIIALNPTFLDDIQVELLAFMGSTPKLSVAAAAIGKTLLEAGIIIGGVAAGVTLLIAAVPSTAVVAGATAIGFVLYGIVDGVPKVIHSVTVLIYSEDFDETFDAASSLTEGLLEVAPAAKALPAARLSITSTGQIVQAGKKSVVILVGNIPDLSAAAQSIKAGLKLGGNRAYNYLAQEGLELKKKAGAYVVYARTVLNSEMQLQKKGWLRIMGGPQGELAGASQLDDYFGIKPERPPLVEDWMAMASGRQSGAGKSTSVSWPSAKKAYYEALAAREAVNPSGKFSVNNIAEMAQGRPPKISVRMQNRKTGEVRTESIPLELHHKYLPQRMGSGKQHEDWNLELVTRWAHESMDEYRHAGWDLLKILSGPNSW